MPTDTLTASCIGKLPTHGDFVRHRATTPAMRAFDAWVQKGLFRARQHRRNELEAVYDEAPALRFLFNAPNGAPTLLGVMKPSRDRSGRTYPFTVSTEVPRQEGSTRHLGYLPGQAATFYADAARLVRQATGGRLDHREVAERVQQLSPAIGRSTAPSQGYKRYLQQHTLQALLAEAFGHFGDGRKYRLFNNLFDILLPLRDRGAAQLAYGLQFSLGTEDGALTYQACFWVEVCLRLLGYPAVTPTLFWTAQLPEPDGHTPFLLLFLQPPRPRTFFHLLAADTEDDNICILERMGTQSGAEAALAIPAQYGALLEDERVTLWDFLRKL